MSTNRQTLNLILLQLSLLLLLVSHSENNFGSFLELLSLVKPLVKQKKIRMRLPIPAEERLAITLKFLATGETYDLLMCQFRVYGTTIAKIILEVCKAIYQVFMPTCLSIPTKEGDWQQICYAKFERWNFPNWLQLQMVNILLSQSSLIVDPCTIIIRDFSK